MLQTKHQRHNVVPMESWHPQAISMREELGVDIPSSWWDDMAANGLCHSVLKDGVPYLCAGIQRRWYANAEAWLIIDQSASKMDIGRGGRAVIAFLDEKQKLEEFRRIQTSVNVDDKRAVRWAKYMGFVCEGTAKCYDVIGNDHYIYARIR